MGRALHVAEHPSHHGQVGQRDALGAVRGSGSLERRGHDRGGHEGHGDEEESKTQFAIWSMLGSPLFMSNDLRELPEWARKILTNKEIILIDQDPLGKVATRRTPYEENGVVWSRPLANGDVAVALMNRGDEVRDIELSFQMIGSAKEYSIRDLYLHEELGVFEGKFVGKKIPAHGTMMLRLSAMNYRCLL